MEDKGVRKMKEFIIYGKLVPCSEFIDTEGMLEEAKNKKWIKVCCDDQRIQQWIEFDIWFKGTLQHKIYSLMLYFGSNTTFKGRYIGEDLIEIDLPSGPVATVLGV